MSHSFYLKIKDLPYQSIENTVSRVLNIACIAFGKGDLPKEHEIKSPITTGGYWYESIENNKFEILSGLNNHKAFVRVREESFIVIEFYSRYDRGNKQVNSLSTLIASVFSQDEVELLTEFNLICS